MDNVKVIYDERAGRCDLVPERHGEKLPDGATFAPVPLCKLVMGYGRPWADVKADAEKLCRLWNDSLPGEPATAAEAA